MALCNFGHFDIACFLILSITVKFHIWISHEKRADTYFFILSRLCPFPELWPFEKIWMKSCQQNILKTIKARALIPGE